MYQQPAASAPVETKVKAAGVATYLGLAALLGLLNGVTDINLVQALPDALEVFLAPMIPTAITTVTSYMAKHTPRPDLGQS
jgi:hypothetical protein